MGRSPENRVPLYLPLHKKFIYAPNSEEIHLPMFYGTFLLPIFYRFFSIKYIFVCMITPEHFEPVNQILRATIRRMGAKQNQRDSVSPEL